MSKIRWSRGSKTSRAVAAYFAMGGLPPPGVPFWGYEENGGPVILKPDKKGVYHCPKCGTALHKNRKGPCEPTECFSEYMKWRSDAVRNHRATRSTRRGSDPPKGPRRRGKVRWSRS